MPLFGDPDATRKGITKEFIYDLYSTYFIANPDAIFQHDDAPTHTAYIVRGLLREMNLTVMDWPPYAPDLNSIENL